MTELVFLDIETTGLDPYFHDVWEVAWAVEGGPINTVQLHHSIIHADPYALELNKYAERVQERTEFVDDSVVQNALKGATIVGANPSFDTSFLSFRWDSYSDFLYDNRTRLAESSPWHHRKIDISTLAMPIFGWDRPKGQADVAASLRNIGHDIDVPDHTAAQDVKVLRQCYYALMIEGKYQRESTYTQRD